MGRSTAKGVRPCTKTGLHDRRVGFPMPLRNALRPQARGVRASHPAPTPNWAFAAGTRGFTAMPFEGFLGPSSEAADLTRILRRRLAEPVYHFFSAYSREYTEFFNKFTSYSQSDSPWGEGNALCREKPAGQRMPGIQPRRLAFVLTAQK